jgi:hypothetical protein
MTWYADLPHEQAGGDGGIRSITQFVVIHATDNTASDEAEANYAETRPDHTSAHFYSDGDTVIQALDTDHIAFGCYPIGNSRSVQFEISGLSNQLTDASLRKVAPIVARVCQEYGLPIRKVSSTDLANGVKGICGHLDVTYAWGEGDHTDPGANFPWSTFIGYVAAAAADPAAVSGGDDMAQFLTIQLPVGAGEHVTQTLTPAGGAKYAYSAVTLTICNDTFGEPYKLRLYATNGDGRWGKLTPGTETDSPTFQSGTYRNFALDPHVRCVSIRRDKASDTDACDQPLTALVVWE